MTEHKKPREWVLEQAVYGKQLVFEIEQGPALPYGEYVRVLEAEPVERELERVYADQQLKSS